MKNTRWMAIGLSCALLFSTIEGFGQEPKIPGWENLKQISTGQKLSIEEKSGKKWKGYVRAIADNSLELERGGKSYLIQAEAVKSVYRIEKVDLSKKIFSMLGGAGVGVAAGIGVGVLGAQACEGECYGALIGVFVAMIGLGVVGAIVGRKLVNERGKILLYRAP
jgi:hypothetical protein